MTEPLFTADADPIELGLVELRGVHRYPFSDEIDRPLVRRLVNEFPTVDVPREIQKWGLWLTEHPEVTKPKKKRTNYRARLLTWIERAASYQRGGSGGPGPATVAHRPEAYGSTSESLERW